MANEKDNEVLKQIQMWGKQFLKDNVDNNQTETFSSLSIYSTANGTSSASLRNLRA